MTDKPDKPLKSLTVRVTEDEHRQLKQLALDCDATAQGMIRAWIRSTWAKREGGK